jgi:hypothetical protein
MRRDDPVRIGEAGPTRVRISKGFWWASDDQVSIVDPVPIGEQNIQQGIPSVRHTQSRGVKLLKCHAWP